MGGPSLAPAVRVARLVAVVVIGGLAAVGALELGPRGFAFAGVTVLLAATLGRVAGAARDLPTWLRRGAQVTRYVGRAVIGLLMLIGATAVSGGLGMLVLAALVTWGVVHVRARVDAAEFVGRRCRGRPGDVGALERHLRLLDEEALCQLWRQCRQVLALSRHSVRQQLEMSVVRQAVLAEFERRDPLAFSAWLARGAPDDPPIRADGRR